MIFGRLSEIADSAARRYDVMALAWQLLFHNALSAFNFGSTDCSTRMVAEAYSIADVYLSTERKLAGELFSEIALDAHTATITQLSSIDAETLSPLALTHLQETESYLFDEIVAQIHRDIAMLRHSLQMAVLDVSVIQRAAGLDARDALMRYRVTTDPQVEFIFSDRAGRKWNAKKFVRTVWRQVLLSTYNEVVLQDLSSHGLELAAIVTDEGVIGEISLIGAEDLPSYAEIRDTQFQPNANACLAAPEVAHVSA